MMQTAATTIDTIEMLERLYGAPSERAVLKQMDRLDAHSRAFIEASPFVLLATCGPVTGVDCSPRGDQAGFVQVLDERTLLIPDRRGNNRVDSLRNIVEQPAVGLLFLVPGVDESFRVNGQATISVDPTLIDRFVVLGQRPKSVVIVTVQEAFMQCSRAILRADLWNPANRTTREQLSSPGTMLAAHTGGRVDADEYDAYVRDTVPETLY